MNAVVNAIDFPAARVEAMNGVFSESKMEHLDSSGECNPWKTEKPA